MVWPSSYIREIIKIPWHRQRWAIFLAMHMSAPPPHWSPATLVFPRKYKYLHPGRDSLDFLSTVFFIYSFKPFPSHELPFLFPWLYPVGIRGFCFHTDLESFLPGIQIPASDVRAGDNGPLLAAGEGRAEETGELQSPRAGQVDTLHVCEWPSVSQQWFTVHFHDTVALTCKAVFWKSSVFSDLRTLCDVHRFSKELNHSKQSRIYCRCQLSITIHSSWLTTYPNLPEAESVQ